MNKKNFKYVFMLMIILMGAITFTSCGGDDNSNDSSLSFDKDYLVGTWTITSLNGTSPWSRVKVGKTITFNSDGSCTGSTMEKAWKLSNGKVTTIYDTTTGEPCYVYTLLAKNGNTATVEIRGTLDETDKYVNVIMTKQ